MTDLRPTLRLVVANPASAPSPGTPGQPKSTDQLYREGSCTEEECRLCRTPIWARRAGQFHSDISGYPPPASRRS
jgi:hypothetical protein